MSRLSAAYLAAAYAQVPPATWKAALRHFAERQLPEVTFRRLLEQRAARGKAAADRRSDALQLAPPAAPDAG